MIKSIAIGILTYKRTDYLVDLINDINETNYQVELIIVNNNESDDVISVINSAINSKKIELTYLWDKINYGVSKGRRKIVENTRSDYLILLDDDVHVSDINTVIENVIYEFSHDKTLAGIAFNIIEYQTKHHNRYEIPHKNKNINMKQDFYTYLMIGAGMAVKTQVVLDAGNFSQELGPYGFEEVDITFRIINAGYHIKYLTKCIIEHKKSPDGRFNNEMVNYYALLNRTIIAKKYLKNYLYLSCFVIRSVFFIAKTRNIALFIDAVTKIIKVKNINKFDKNFYTYCKKVNAFLLY